VQQKPRRPKRARKRAREGEREREGGRERECSLPIQRHSLQVGLFGLLLHPRDDDLGASSLHRKVSKKQSTNLPSPKEVRTTR
jgi:hypothetical protein